MFISGTEEDNSVSDGLWLMTTRAELYPQILIDRISLSSQMGDLMSISLELQYVTDSLVLSTGFLNDLLFSKTY